MSTLLILMIILVLTAWLGSFVVQLEREIGKARRRRNAAQEKEQRLRLMLDSLLSEERTLGQQTNDQKRLNSEVTKSVEALRTALAEHMRAGRQRLLVLSPRRHPGDRDWIVILANPTLQRSDPTLPLADEWARGRAYLVFARNEHEARERSVRRFGSRPGVIVKAVSPAPDDLFTAPPVPGNSPS